MNLIYTEEKREEELANRHWAVAEPAWSPKLEAGDDS
jgi:hypothetical protein